ncbi:MAG: cysteine desulfurase [Paludibacteraceae bacterium]|nr:cysteine desulfurase [Paludibacteraceae bacterium]
MTIDVNAIRQDFPILQTQVYERPLVYLDNAATTQKPKCVVEKIAANYYKENANVHRGVHFLSQVATEAHEAAREEVRKFINARHSHEVIFTRGTTESINLVASSFGRLKLQPGDEVIVSQMEHHSNIVPWQLLPGVEVRPIPFAEDGTLLVDQLEELINGKTKIISVAHVSNTLGSVNPVKQIIAIAHAHNIPVLVDGAQGVPHTKVDVQDLDADFYAFSGHKIYGPTGIGVLYGKEEWLNQLPPYQGGGDMIDRVTFAKTTYADLPFKFEAGTPDFIGSTALAEALRYVQQVGIENIAAHEADLLQYATSQLKEIAGVRIYGESAHKSSVVSFLVDGIHPYDMGTILDKLGIAVRTGHHCAQPVMDAFGVEGMVRASFAMYNTREEVDQLVAGVKRIVKLFHRQ